MIYNVELLINEEKQVIKMCRKTPPFRAGDTRRVHQIYVSKCTVGHTGIHAWGNRVRRQFFGGGAVVVEPRIPCLQAWECQGAVKEYRKEILA